MALLFGLGDDVVEDPRLAACLAQCSAMLPPSYPAPPGYAESVQQCNANCLMNYPYLTEGSIVTDLPPGAVPVSTLPPSLTPPPGSVPSAPTNWWRVGLVVAVGVVGVVAGISVWKRIGHAA